VRTIANKNGKEFEEVLQSSNSGWQAQVERDPGVKDIANRVLSGGEVNLLLEHDIVGEVRDKLLGWGVDPTPAQGSARQALHLDNDAIKSLLEPRRKL